MSKRPYEDGVHYLLTKRVVSKEKVVYNDDGSSTLRYEAIMVNIARGKDNVGIQRRDFNSMMEF